MLIFILIISVFNAILNSNGFELNSEQKSKLREIATDFGFGSTVVECLSQISKQSVDCVLDTSAKWEQIATYGSNIQVRTARVCCQKWDEMDCIIGAAIEMCAYDGYQAIRESQLLFRQLMEAEACINYTYASIECIEANVDNCRQLGLHDFSLHFFIIAFICIIFIIYITFR